MIASDLIWPEWTWNSCLKKMTIWNEHTKIRGKEIAVILMGYGTKRLPNATAALSIQFKFQSKAECLIDRTLLFLLLTFLMLSFKHPARCSSNWAFWLWNISSSISEREVHVFCRWHFESRSWRLYSGSSGGEEELWKTFMHWINWLCKTWLQRTTTKDEGEENHKWR